MNFYYNEVKYFAMHVFEKNQLFDLRSKLQEYET